MRHFPPSVVAVLSAFAAVSARAQTPLDTAFTFQGELASSGTPATGTHDIRFRLYDAATDGSQIGSTLCSDDLEVAAGRFAASLDFDSAFAGQKRFLEIEVRQDTGLGCSDATGYTLLTPRQELTAAPNATYAQAAGIATTALTAANATSLNGQLPSFYQNAANLSGTLADARLSPNVPLLNSPNVFSSLGDTQFAGPVGLGITPRSGSRFEVWGGYGVPAVDQSQATVPNSVGAGDQWQSFTAGVTGLLRSVRLGVGSPLINQPSPGTIQIYEGEGIGGQLLTTQAVTFATGSPFNTLQEFAFTSAPTVTSGAVYTVRFSAPSVLVAWVGVSTANPYPGGRCNINPGWDYRFQTLVSASQTGLIVNDSGVSIGSAAPPPAAGGISVAGASSFAANVSAVSFTGSGAGLTSLPAANLTGSVPAASLTAVPAGSLTGTISQDVLPVSAWVNLALPTGAISSPGFSTVAGTSATLPMRQGVAVVSWSFSGYSSVAFTDINLRVRAVTNGTSTFGPVTIFTFNQAGVHTTISGNAVVNIPATANTTFSLEVARTAGAGVFSTDSRDSFTATIINIGQ